MPRIEELTGIVLAAGGGRRAGGPKALRSTADGEPWLRRATDFLTASGCSRVVVVLGAGAEAARELAPPSATVVVNHEWAKGMSGSLTAGLAASAGLAALITLVDLPDLPSSVGRRLCDPPLTADVLRQAVFDGRPGHPVLIGAAHWVAVADEATGDHGARPYLVRHSVDEIECGDLSDGQDVDR